VFSKLTLIILTSWCSDNTGNVLERFEVSRCHEILCTIGLTLAGSRLLSYKLFGIELVISTLSEEEVREQCVRTKQRKLMFLVPEMGESSWIGAQGLL